MEWLLIITVFCESHLRCTAKTYQAYWIQETYRMTSCLKFGYGVEVEGL